MIFKKLFLLACISRTKIRVSRSHKKLMVVVTHSTLLGWVTHYCESWLEVWYDIGIRIWYRKSDIYRKSDMISEFGYDIGSRIYYIGSRIWYKTCKKLCDYIVWLFDSNGAPYVGVNRQLHNITAVIIWHLHTVF